MNTLARNLAAAPAESTVGQIVKMAILAVGGQGGGVLCNWITSLAERGGHDVQATSVAGVAQRTGSTIYYVEMLPASGRRPVFSLSPTEGDVDIVVAAELMEAGRAIMRGFVTPGRTRMIVSTHRQLATQEKVVPGDGTADGDRILEAIGEVAERPTAFDMQAVADEEGTVISASLFGAIAGSGALPFDAEDFRETIRAWDREAARSLAAFERARAIAAGEAPTPSASEAEAPAAPALRGPERLRDAWRGLLSRAAALPAPAREMAKAGMRKLVEFQDVAYAEEYLGQLEEIAREDDRAGGAGKDFAFTTAAAKHLANAMAYDDVIRVADAKTRPGRLERIDDEVGASSAQVVRVTEYTHPRAVEIASLMPARAGRWMTARKRLMSAIDRLASRGRRIRTDRVGGFLALYLVAGLRPWRRSLLRHAGELAHVGEWLSTARARLPRNYDFAVQTLRCRRLIKGYSDTHARGLSRFDRVMEGAALVAERDADAADWTRRLIDAALADHDDRALDGALDTIRSFAGSDEERNQEADP